MLVTGYMLKKTFKYAVFLGHQFHYLNIIIMFFNRIFILFKYSFYHIDLMISFSL